jgi:hypothetical protein
MVNKILSGFAFLAAVALGLILGTAAVLGILYSIPKITGKLDYYD